jgi:sigma-E factor negative regulatory protein RseB
MTVGASGLRAAVLLFLALPLAAAADEALDWLSRMEQALRELNYEGRFVYVHGHAIETMHLVHTVDGGRERERLSSLNDAAREVLRDDEGMTCVMPDTGTVSVGPRHPGRAAGLRALDLANLSVAYTARVDGEGRVAGRPAVLLSLEPKDRLRYGYRLALDSETALPLKTTLLDESGAPFVQTMFVDLRVGDEVQTVADAQSPAAPGAGPTGPAGRVEVDTALPWEFADVPPGFRLTTALRRTLPGTGREMRHVVFSDGVASVSVYITAPGSNDLQGEAAVGPVNAFGVRTADHQATALGEVPVATLQTLLAGLRPRTEGTR